MKNYFTLILLLASFICLGQSAPISEFVISDMISTNVLIHPLFDGGEKGNSVVLTSSDKIEVVILDKNLKKVKNFNLMREVFGTYSLEQFFQDENNVYRIYGGRNVTKRHRSPEGWKLDKETFNFSTKKLLKIPKAEKYFCTKLVGDDVYSFTYNPKTFCMKIYKLKGFEVVETTEICNSKLKFFKDFFLKKVVPENVFFENDKFFFTKKGSLLNSLVSSVIGFDLAEKKLLYKDFQYDFNQSKLEIGKENLIESTLKKLFSTEILNGKLLQIFRIKTGFYVNIFDLESGDFLETKSLITDESEQDLDCSTYSTDLAFGLTKTILGRSFMRKNQFNEKNLRFGMNGGSSNFSKIFTTSGSQHLLMFGKRRGIYQNSGAMVPMAGGGFMPGGGRVLMGYKWDYGFMDLNEIDSSDSVLEKGKITIRDIEKLPKSYDVEDTETLFNLKKKRRTNQIVFTDSGFRLVHHNRKTKMVSIY